MKRKPTEEQQKKAAERREKCRQIAKTVSAMPPEARMALIDRLGYVLTVESRPLSVYNSCMLFQQDQQVSVVGGYRQWQAAGRQVRKGEHGLAIWIPTGAKAEPEAAELEGDGEAKPNFILGTVFDISQTDPMPEQA